MIRLAVESDKTRVIQLLRASREAAGFDAATGMTGFTFPFDAPYAERLFLYHLKEPNAVCFLLAPKARAEGVLMATASPHPFGPVKLARETVWWIEPSYRGMSAVRMLDAYEMWAKQQNCQFVGMAGMGEDPDVAKLYLRRGFKVAETHYLKAV